MEKAAMVKASSSKGMNGRKRNFFLEFLKNPREIGSIIPSSPFLAKAMIKEIDFTKAKAIVEFGPGDGCITKPLLTRMSAQTDLFAFEVNERFCDMLHPQVEKHPNLHLFNQSAEDVKAVLRARGIEYANYIVSGLPMVILPPELRERIWQASLKILKPGGLYFQYHYSTALQSEYKRLFDSVEIKLVPLNIPPAYVFTCRKHH